MADSNLAGLSALTVPAADDLLYIVHDPGGTPSDRKIRVDQLGKVAHKFATRTAGSLTLDQTAITDVGVSDIALNAVAGDTIEYGIMGVVGSAATAKVGFDVYTIVAATPVNPFGAGLSASLASTQGVPGWFVTDTLNAEINVRGSAMYTVVSGDISGGTVTLRLRYAKANATARTFFATANVPLQVWAKNLSAAAA